MTIKPRKPAPPGAAALNDVIAELTASLARSLGVNTAEGYTSLCDAVTEATDGWEAEQIRHLFRDANGRIQSYDGLTGDPGDWSKHVPLRRYALWTPLRDA